MENNRIDELNELKKLHNEFKILENKIKEYEYIIIYRHASPDFDALGSQYGLQNWIIDNFPNKHVYCVGDINDNLIPFIYPIPNRVNELPLDKIHLAISLDCADKNRISENQIDKAKEVIKIDHHHLPIEEKDRFGNYIFVHDKFPSVCEIIALFCLSRPKKYITSSLVAMYLYSGIIGDTNRFLYNNTRASTLRIAADLLEKGFDKNELYSKIYQIDLRRFNILKYTLTNYKLSKAGTAYIVFDKDQLKKLNMKVYEANNYLDRLRDIDGIKIIISISYSEKENNYRLSFRTKDIKIVELANKYEGGGHDFACGGKLSSLDKLDKLIKEADNLIKANIH